MEVGLINQGPYGAFKVLKSLEFDWTKFKALKSMNFTKWSWKVLNLIVVNKMSDKEI